LDFVHLHSHTNMSMLDAIQSCDELFDAVHKLGHKALAITDHGVLSSFHDAYKAYVRTGVKFIPGCEMYFVHSYDSFISDKGRRKTERRKHIVLLAQNEIGYKNLLKLNYLGFQHYVVVMGKVFPRISWDILEEHSEGIISTSACGGGILAEYIFKNDYEGAVQQAQRLSSIFPDRFYLEIQPHNLEKGDFNQIMLNNTIIKIAKELNLPLVAGNDAHYLTQDHAKVHDVLLAINSKKSVTDPERYSYGIEEFYVKDGQQIYDFLKEYHGEEVAEEAVENTTKIAAQCDSPDYMKPSGNHLPIFPVKDEKDYEEFVEWRKTSKIPSSLAEDKAFMRFRIIKGFKRRFGNLSKNERDIRWKRVQKELKVLENNDFSSYMLVTADYIQWAKDNDILVGIARGSVGGCLIAYLLGIHGIDPIEYDLIFERFQNAYKTDLPDIDTDFTSSGRDIVQEYVRQKYGIDNCAHVSNLNLYTPKSVIPDLVKSMRDVLPNLIPENEHYVKVSDNIKSFIPDEDENGKVIKTLEKAISFSPKLKQLMDKEPALQQYADSLIGLPKTFSTHAGGVIIADKPIYNYAPLRVDKHGVVAVQYEKNRCETEGLVKMDFLAISTLDVIDETFKNIRKLGVSNAPRQMEDVPLDDEETYKMIQSGQTKCVFQLGKSGIMALLCKKIKPKNILDIAMINALGRPSAKDIRNDFINRRNGKGKISYPHMSLKEALGKTYGLTITEEQLMSLSSCVAGWDLNKADGLRKLTKLKGKNPELAEKLEIDFVNDAVKKHNMDVKTAQYIWDHYVGGFMGYGFNLAHAVAYSINGYITAYLKRHYPSAFLAAYLKIKTASGGLSRDDEINAAKGECKRLGIKIIPPDINNSKSGYEVLDNKTIVMGLSAIKGMGDKAVNDIVAKQPFIDIKDFLYRTEARVVNKSKLNVLAKAGCFDAFNLSRQSVFVRAVDARKKIKTFIKNKEKDGYDVEMALNDLVIDINGNEWDKKELLLNEQEVLGELVSGTVDDIFPNFFTKQSSASLKNLKQLPDKHSVFVEVMVKELNREIRLKSGKNRGKLMLKYTLEDIYGNEVDLTVWPDDYKRAKLYLKEGRPVKINASVNEYNGSKGLILQKICEVYKSE